MKSDLENVFIFLGSIALCTGAGYLIDEHIFDTNQLTIVAGFVIGLVSGIVILLIRSRREYGD